MSRLHQPFVAHPRAATAVFALSLAIVLILAIPQPAQAQTFDVLYNFTGGADGRTPSSGVLLGPDGSLYGNTVGQGSTLNGDCEAGKKEGGCGTVFKLTNTGSGWTLTTLYSFQGGTDGDAPWGMTFAPDGSLYGVTAGGGVPLRLCAEFFPYYGCGTVFKLTPDSGGSWTESVLYRFQEQGLDGWFPDAPPVLDSVGNVYGTTGGPGECGQSGACGAAYKLTPSGGGWNESVIFYFGAEGWGPNGVVIDPAGNLYGTTWSGGDLQGDSPLIYNDGNGVAFELTPSSNSWNETVLHDFNLRLQLGGGVNPSGGLTFDHEGNLYGVTIIGGFNYAGTVFQLTPEGNNWTFQTLYSLQGSDQLGPIGSVVIDSAGNLYGVRDGLSDTHIPNYGTVFKLTHTSSGWIYSVLHEFISSSGGKYVPGALTLDANGNIYGTARSGGAYGYGVVWEITP